MTPALLATDLDRTLFPNGNQPDDNSMEIFRKVVERKRPRLVFVTGRNLSQIEAGIREYGTPSPDYAIAEVGTRIYRRTPKGFEEDGEFSAFLAESTTNWNIETFKRALDVLPLRLQPIEHQNEFKLSFYVDNLETAATTVDQARERLQRISPDTQLVWSIDETRNLGLLDVLPGKANKLEALEYLRDHLDLPVEAVIYAGDSGNDLLPLTRGYKAILVANAIEEIRTEVIGKSRERNLSSRLYLASGQTDLPLNGNYVSGILEGLVHFGIISRREWSSLSQGS